MIASAVLVGFILMFGVLLASLEEERRPKYRFPRGTCQGCGYDLAGLPEGTLCPECGHAEPGTPPEVTVRSIVRPGVAPRLGLTCVLAIASFLTVTPFVGAPHRWSYDLQLDRHSPEVLVNALRVRGFDLDWQFAVVPLVIGLYICTFCAGLRQVRFGRLALKTFAACWVLSLAWLFVETFIRYR
ncbi:MAG TPA: hypothetical protein VFF69_07060 [Phycisphaerales bacterium]|nr:hypothetical protein [Phycisphaerales bacterium]